jgi:5-methylcytosine-specific restriction endonuclease McrA
MPISPENKARYPKDWKAISLRVRERAGQKCEFCNAPNGEVIDRSSDGSAYMLMDGQVFSATDGEALGYARGSEWPSCGRLTKVVLTVAHLDHTPENCAEENLKALCQRCHLTYDAKHHAKNAAATRRRKAGIQDLFCEAA